MPRSEDRRPRCWGRRRRQDQQTSFRRLHLRRLRRERERAYCRWRCWVPKALTPPRRRHQRHCRQRQRASTRSSPWYTGPS